MYYGRKIDAIGSGAMGVLETKGGRRVHIARLGCGVRARSA
jgi:hypothetical protein